MSHTTAAPITTYKEVTIGRTIYRMTSEFVGKVDLKTALEDLTVQRVVQEALSGCDKC